MSQRPAAVIITIIVALALGTGIAVAGGSAGQTLGGIPLFILAVAAAFLIQVIAYIPAALLRTEKFFDLTGGLTFALVTVVLLIAVVPASPRAWLLTAMVVAWGVRLSVFLGTAARIGDSSSSRRQCDGRVHDGLELDGRQTAQAGLTASAVVGPLDPGDHRDAQLLAGGPGAAVEDVLL